MSSTVVSKKKWDWNELKQNFPQIQSKCTLQYFPTRMLNVRNSQAEAIENLWFPGDNKHDKCNENGLDANFIWIFQLCLNTRQH